MVKSKSISFFNLDTFVLMKLTKRKYLCETINSSNSYHFIIGDNAGFGVVKHNASTEGLRVRNTEGMGGGRLLNFVLEMMFAVNGHLMAKL